MKTAEMDAAPKRGATALLVLSLLGTAWALLTARRRAFLWTLLLWLPVPFYAYSIAYRFGAHLPSRLVAALLVQHPLRNGTAARLRAWPRIRRALLF